MFTALEYWLAGHRQFQLVYHTISKDSNLYSTYIGSPLGCVGHDNTKEVIGASLCIAQVLLTKYVAYASLGHIVCILDTSCCS